jgi:multiple sugar transport system ATP-binding protein
MLGDLRTQTAALERRNGHDIVLGVRPEDLQPAADEAAALTAVVEVIEPIGNEVFLNLRFGDKPLVSRVLPHQMPAPSTALQMGFATDRLHFFDAGSGTRIA